MAYIGTSPSNGVRRRFVYEATSNQTSFSGNDESGITLTYVDSLYLDVYQNGVKLKAGDDYTATTGTTVVLAAGATADDVVEMVSFDVFSVNDSVSAGSGGSFGGAIASSGTVTATGGLIIGNGTNIGTVGDTDAISIASNGVVTFSQTPVGDNAGAIVQVVNVQTGTVASGTTTMALDNTIPQKTEGNEFMTLAITPTSSSNKLLIEVSIQLDKNNGNTYMVALFQDSTANALAGIFTGGRGSGQSEYNSFKHFMTAGTTSATTFKVRAGSDGSGTITFNGRGGGAMFGGVSVSSITISEIAV